MKITIFTGSEKDFVGLTSKIPQDKQRMLFSELLRKPRVDEIHHKGIRENDEIREKDKPKSDIDLLIIGANDFASAKEHVISNFYRFISYEYNFKETYIHNPPDLVTKSLEALELEIIRDGSQYAKIDICKVRAAYADSQKHITGQEDARKHIVSSLYRHMRKNNTKPSVLLLYGPSGVGKTEVIKIVGKTLGGNLQRIQFSMMNTEKSLKYISGSEHYENSFSRDLLSRESNIILLDEFDKVSPVFYNAFYQLFDEGVYRDNFYTVDARDCVFFCTSNFPTQEDAISHMGEPIFSRFDDFIQFNPFSQEEKSFLVDSIIAEIIGSLEAEDLAIVESNNIQDKVSKFYKSNTDNYGNFRIMRRNINKDIYALILEEIKVFEV